MRIMRNRVWVGLAVLFVLLVCNTADACTIEVDVEGDYVAKSGDQSDYLPLTFEVTGTTEGKIYLESSNGGGEVRFRDEGYNIVTWLDVADRNKNFWVEGITESSAAADVTVTATLKDTDENTLGTNTDTVTVVKVNKVQYQSGANWVDVSGTLYVSKGSTVTFKAVPAPAAASWPSGKPVWGGTAGATGTGTMKAVTFNTVSSNLTDFKTVTAECGNTITANVIVVQVEVTHIKFDHAAGHAADGIDIRENNSTNITVPEWVKGGQNKPGAYTKSTNVTIKARFTVSPSAITSAKVRATTADAILGNLGEQTITFASGVSTPEYVSFTPTNATPGAVGKGTVTWQWRTKHIEGSDLGDEANINSSGPHTIYTVLATPTAPMAEPWTEVLDKSCVWANGQTTTTGAAGKVTDSIYTSGYEYDNVGGAPQYYDGGDFNLTECLSEWGDDTCDINCWDCAQMVAIFSNALGCTLQTYHITCSCNLQCPSCHHVFTRGYLLNQIKPIGRDWTNDPFTANCRNLFTYHETAWPNIYDACLQVDSDGNPIMQPCIGEQPKNMAFGDYRDKFVDPGDKTWVSGAARAPASVK